MRDFLKKEGILDIIIFGSIVREKENPNDIDILVITGNNARKFIDISYELRKKLEPIIKKPHVLTFSFEELFSPSFLAREAILSEGYSMRKKELISELLGYSSLVLFKYSLRGLGKSKRMSFYYALYGRGKQGLLEKTKCYKFSDSIILCPIENSELIKDFLNRQKIKFEEFPILIPERIKSYKLKDE